MGIEDGLGLLSQKLILALLVSWIFVYVMICKGVKSKVAYFLTLFPYIVMVSLLIIRAVTLDRAIDGIVCLFKLTWHKIPEPAVWYAAVIQSFFSLGVCFDAMYSSHNNFEHNVSKCVNISRIILPCPDENFSFNTFNKEYSLNLLNLWSEISLEETENQPVSKRK